MKWLVVWLASYSVTCWTGPPSADPYSGQSPQVFGSYDYQEGRCKLRYRWFNSEQEAQAFAEKMPKRFPHFVTQSNKSSTLAIEDATEYDISIKPLKVSE